MKALVGAAPDEPETRRLRALALSAENPRHRQQGRELIVEGRHNKEVADTLGISVRTVEVHKARIMTKLCVDGVSGLVRLSLAAHL